MKLLSLSGRRVQHWPEIEDEADLTPQTHGVVSLSRLSAQRETVAQALTSVGVAVDGHTDPADVAPYLDAVRLIVVRFPAFKDGRGFTLAARLRKDWGYTGEVRASGPVLPDQAAFLLRCGFDSLEIADDRAAAAEAALRHFSVAMQPTALGDSRTTALFQRHETAGEPRRHAS